MRHGTPVGIFFRSTSAISNSFRAPPQKRSTARISMMWLMSYDRVAMRSSALCRRYLKRGRRSVSTESAREIGIASKEELTAETLETSSE
jgi:hypothetical protein